jgi:hypothetical protein
MLKKAILETLADDFRRWGKRRTKRIQSLTKKYGVICDADKFSNGTKG